jgi:hypothetical protein
MHISLPLRDNESVHSELAVPAEESEAQLHGGTSISSRRSSKEVLAVKVARAILVLLGVGVTRIALAAPPPNADPSLAPWYESLHTKNGLSCCGEADCRHFPVQIDGGRYWILYEGKWVGVPDESVDRERMDNPTGDYVACVVQHRTPTLVLCFFLRPNA